MVHLTNGKQQHLDLVGRQTVMDERFPRLAPTLAAGPQEQVRELGHLKLLDRSQDGCDAGYSQPDNTTRTARAAEIVLDREFRDLVPPPPPQEQARIVQRLLDQDGREPLIVWQFCRRLILLVGYDRFAALKHYGVPFAIQVKDFHSREQARRFIIEHRLARPNLTPLEISYLLGLRYVDDKQAHGGDRRSQQVLGSSPAGTKTADALAEMLSENAATIRRGAALVAAVKQVARFCGADTMPLLFSRTAKLSRQAILDLAALPPDRLRPLIGTLRLKGKLPRSWRRQTGSRSSTITLPWERRAMVEAMWRRLGRAWLAGLLEIIEDVLTTHEDGTPAAPACAKIPAPEEHHS